ncbi:sodium/solute symporter [bacterium]|nr:sodium/solute symporter [bacterium]
MLLASVTSSLHPIDYAIIAVYVVGTLLIGSYYSRHVSSAGDLLLAGKALPFWAIAMSVVVTDIGATNLTFGAGNAYKLGISQANFDWIGSMPACVIAGLLFVPFFWRSGVYTIPEFLGRRYNKIVQRTSALLWLGFLAINLGIMMHASAVILGSFVGFNYYLSVWGTGLVVGFYTVSGGLAAVVMTDALQMIVIFIGTSALLAVGLWEVGGFSGMQEKLAAMAAQGADTANHLNLLLPHGTETALPWTAVVLSLGLLQSTSYFANNQAIVQRNLGARTEWDAMAGMILAGLMKVFIPILIFVPGLIARALFPDLADSNSAIPTMILELFPPGLTGLMVAAFLAAFMSGVSSYLNSTSTMFLADVYMPTYRSFAGRDIRDGHAMTVGRMTTVVSIVLACSAAPLFDEKNVGQTIYNLIQTLMSIFYGPTLAIMLLGVLWKRANQWGATAGLLLGVLLATYLTFRGGPLFASKEPFLFITMISFLFGVALVVIVSLLTPRDPDEKSNGLVLFDLVNRSPVTPPAEVRG